MIFIYNYFKVPDVPKDLEPLSEFIKKYNKVLVADIDTFAVFIDEVYKKFNSIPNVNEKYTLNLSDSSIAIDDNEIPFSVISIGFSNILGLWGFQTSESSTQCDQQNLEILPVPDKGEAIFSLPDYLKSIIKKGGAK
ncbi:hypothetical protein HMPREF2139_06960 [Prevotella denticola DNF00960]|uniref:hypothetical protein n=1 Tax=Prevotella denticola TaxID=28129 RepID=UPI00050EA53D|nr:hypothetical protein [Prevotella denticola]KGF40726.1 hypothetical protein HMPREF2139_06960 [Prevotella denticola DNF00960]